MGMANYGPETKLNVFWWGWQTMGPATWKIVPKAVQWQNMGPVQNFSRSVTGDMETAATVLTLTNSVNYRL